MRICNKVFHITSITYVVSGMDKLLPPDPLDLDSSNVSDVWRTMFWTPITGSSKEDGIQATTLLHVVGPDTLDVYDTFSWEDAGDKNK